MILISHRGNVNGRIPSLENNPDYINAALNSGFDCEVDVRFIDSKFYLGHDKPEHKINIEFLQNERIWCHAKDGETLIELLKTSVHCFYIDIDNVTLTSKNIIWLSPTNKYILPGVICVKPEDSRWRDINTDNLKLCKGLCSDYIILYENYKIKK